MDLLTLINVVIIAIGFVASVIQLIDFWQKHREKRRLKQPAAPPSSLPQRSYQRVFQRSPKLPLTPSSRQDWGEAIAAPTFYGREAELHQLSDWIGNDYCRLIAILGIGGIGKTTLSIQ